MLYIDTDICTGCGLCVETCKQQALALQDGVAVIDSRACTGCNRCLAACPVGAIRAAELITAGVSASDSGQSTSGPERSPESWAALDSTRTVELAPHPSARSMGSTERPFPPALASDSLSSPPTAEAGVALARRLLSFVVGLAGRSRREAKLAAPDDQTLRGGGRGGRYQRQRLRRAAGLGRDGGSGRGGGRGRSCSGAGRGRR